MSSLEYDLSRGIQRYPHEPNPFNCPARERELVERNRFIMKNSKQINAFRDEEKRRNKSRAKERVKVPDSDDELFESSKPRKRRIIEEEI
jgi:hypothetical protein